MNILIGKRKGRILGDFGVSRAIDFRQMRRTVKYWAPEKCCLNVEKFDDRSGLGTRDINGRSRLWEISPV